MKLQKLFIFAIMIFAAIAAQALNVAAQKKNASRDWVVFTGYQTVSTDRAPIAPPKFLCNSHIYATANFAAPVDLSEGFYVTIAADGELLVQQQFSVENAPRSIRSIPVDLIPGDDADLGFPDAAYAFSRKLLTELEPGVHKITVAVSIGESDETIAAGNFLFDNRDGFCAESFERVEKLINGEPTGDTETETPEDRTEEDAPPAPPVRPQPNKSQQQPQGNDRNYVTFVNECAEEKYVSYQYPNGTFSTFLVQKGFPRNSDYPVGTKFWNGNLMGGEPFYVLPASQYTDEMDKARSQQSITICQ